MSDCDKCIFSKLPADLALSAGSSPFFYFHITLTGGLHPRLSRQTNCAPILLTAGDWSDCFPNTDQTAWPNRNEILQFPNRQKQSVSLDAPPVLEWLHWPPTAPYRLFSQQTASSPARRRLPARHGLQTIMNMHFRRRAHTFWHDSKLLELSLVFHTVACKHGSYELAPADGPPRREFIFAWTVMCRTGRCARRIKIGLLGRLHFYLRSFEKLDLCGAPWSCGGNEKNVRNL